VNIDAWFMICIFLSFNPFCMWMMSAISV
jgi:hypothetical protein